MDRRTVFGSLSQNINDNRLVVAIDVIAVVTDN
jgi:hypothetical protein